jgi:hypothetical protein
MLVAKNRARIFSYSLNTSALPSHQFQFHRFPKCCRSVCQGRQLQARFGIGEQAVECGAAGVLALRHGGFGEFLRLHFFFNLQGQRFFDGGSGGGFKDTLFLQEIVEFASNGHDDGRFAREIYPITVSAH